MSAEASHKRKRANDEPTPSVYGPVPARVSSLIESALAGKKQAASDFLLLHADFCPFANRAWIALLEKEGNPEAPTLFDELQSCYWMGKKDAGTEILYDLGLSTVPAAVHRGQIFSESQSVADLIDDLFPTPPLKPANPIMRFNFYRFLEDHSGFPGAFYSFLRAQEQNKQKELSENLLGLLIKFNENLGKIEGPYLCGNQFTLADINMFGFIERILVVLPHYRNFEIPSHLSNIFSWWKAVTSRASVKVVTSPRHGLSLTTQAFESSDRDSYLKEVYATYAADDLPLCKKIQAELGAPNYNAYRRFKEGGQ